MVTWQVHHFLLKTVQMYSQFISRCEEKSKKQFEQEEKIREEQRKVYMYLFI